MKKVRSSRLGRWKTSGIEAKRLLKEARAHKNARPKTLFIPNELLANNLTLEAERQKVTIVRVAESQLLVFIGEAREGLSTRRRCQCRVYEGQGRSLGRSKGRS